MMMMIKKITMMTMKKMILVGGSNMLVQTQVTSAWRRPKVAFQHPMIYNLNSQEDPEDENDDGQDHVHDNEDDSCGDYESDGWRNLLSSHDLQFTIMTLPSELEHLIMLNWDAGSAGLKPEYYGTVCQPE